MTIPLKDNLIEELGKKKAQVVREALQDYFDIHSVTKTVQDYKMGMIKTISHDDVKKSLGL
jgi:predicted DNA-binding protein